MFDINVIPAVGQRWQYITTDFYILAEIININPIQTIILQANTYAQNQGYIIGRTDRGSMGLEKTLTDWRLLPGQDKPK